MKSINLLKILAHTSWGANHSSLLYTAQLFVPNLITDLLSMALQEIISFQTIEPVANAALRLSLGA